MKKMYMIGYVICMLFISVMLSPISHAATGIIGPTVIHKASDQILTVDTIMGLYQSDTQLQTVTDEYTGFGNISGIYEIVLSNGDALKTVTVHVIDGWSYGSLSLDNPTDIICVTDFKNVHVKSTRILTPTEIVQYILTSTGYVTIDAQTGMSVITDTYTNHTETPGMYQLEFRLVSTSGFDQSYTLNVYVTEGMDLWVGGYVFDAPPSAVESMMQYVVPIALVFLVIWIVIIYFKKRG